MLDFFIIEEFEIFSNRNLFLFHLESTILGVKFEVDTVHNMGFFVPPVSYHTLVLEFLYY